MTREEFLGNFSDKEKLNIADMVLGYFYDTRYPDMAERITALQQRVSSDPAYRELCSTVREIKPPVL